MVLQSPSLATFLVDLKTSSVDHATEQLAACALPPLSPRLRYLSSLPLLLAHHHC